MVANGKFIAALFIFVSMFSVTKAQTPPEENPKLNQGETSQASNTLVFIKDIEGIARLDRLTTELYIGNEYEAYENISCDIDSNLFLDSVIMMKLKEMDQQSTISFDYNEDVLHYIKLYLGKRKNFVRKVLGLSKLYFPLYEEKIDLYNLPFELKYLSMIESGLNPVALSRAGAKGLWQFMPSTGSLYGLGSDYYSDDRCNPYMSTEAACQHFDDLYKRYGDWLLCLAAYNAGPGNVNRAIKKANGSKNYWEVRQHLPRETRRYVPVFIAVSYAIHYAEEYGITPSREVPHFFELDTVQISQETSLDQIAEVLNIPIDTLQLLNPSNKKNVIAINEEHSNYLCLPKKKIAAFIVNQEYIYYTPDSNENTIIANENNASKTVHKVEKGQSLTIIASRYDCSVTDIMQWNKLDERLIHPGQEIIICN